MVLPTHRQHSSPLTVTAHKLCWCRSLTLELRRYQRFFAIWRQSSLKVPFVYLSLLGSWVVLLTSSLACVQFTRTWTSFLSVEVAFAQVMSSTFHFHRLAVSSTGWLLRGCFELAGAVGASASIAVGIVETLDLTVTLGGLFTVLSFTSQILIKWSFAPNPFILLLIVKLSHRAPSSVFTVLISISTALGEVVIIWVPLLLHLRLIGRIARHISTTIISV